MFSIIIITSKVRLKSKNQNCYITIIYSIHNFISQRRERKKKKQFNRAVCYKFLKTTSV